MAKKIYNEQGKVVRYEPGVIYELVYNDVPFYVGETTDMDRRLNEHEACGRDPVKNTETKYQFIAALNSAGLEWSMRKVCEYGDEGPEALEDEHIMSLLYDGITLTNEQKGNANWMTERQAVAADMRERGIRSFHEYRKIVALEAGTKSNETPSPKKHEAVERILNDAWNRSLQPEKKRTNKTTDLNDPERLARIKAETEKLMTAEKERGKSVSQIIKESKIYILEKQGESR